MPNDTGQLTCVTRRDPQTDEQNPRREDELATQRVGKGCLVESGPFLDGSASTLQDVTYSCFSLRMSEGIERLIANPLAA
jgi:hypothetical protein